MNKSGLSKFLILNLSVIFLNAVVDAAPAKSHKHHSVRNLENESGGSGYHLIDEHQNGTDNYRISVKDIVVILVPPESLLTSAASSAASLGANFALHLRQPDLSTLDNLDAPESSTSESNENVNEENESTTLKEEEPPKPLVNPVVEKKSDDFVEAGRADSESHEYPAIVGPFLRRTIKRH